MDNLKHIETIIEDYDKAEYVAALFERGDLLVMENMSKITEITEDYELYKFPAESSDSKPYEVGATVKEVYKELEVFQGIAVMFAELESILEARTDLLDARRYHFLNNDEKLITSAENKLDELLAAHPVTFDYEKVYACRINGNLIKLI